ncbi:hypothetical protein H5410_026878, partial [Solanum commersonii]
TGVGISVIARRKTSQFPIGDYECLAVDKRRKYKQFIKRRERNYRNTLKQDLLQASYKVDVFCGLIERRDSFFD